MKNLLVVVTARASYSRIRHLLISAEKDPRINLTVVLSSSAALTRFGDIEKALQADNIFNVVSLHNVIQGGRDIHSSKMTGLAILDLSNYFLTINPDYVLTIADRFETIATAIASVYLNIPLIHIQGGELTGNVDERVRHAITKLSDIHFVSNEDARARVIKMGEHPDTVLNFGCPSIDIIVKGENIRKLFTNEKASTLGGIGSEFSLKSNYLVVMFHPVTDSLASTRTNLQTLIKNISRLRKKVLWFWPNIDSGSDYVSKTLRVTREESILNEVRFIRNLDSELFLKVLYNSEMIIGNSSVGIRECSFLGVPTMNIGSRQNLRLRGNNVIDLKDGFSDNEFMEAYEKHKKVGKYISSSIYGDGSSAERIVDFIATNEIKKREFYE